VSLGYVDVLSFISSVTFFAKKVMPKNFNCHNSIHHDSKMDEVLVSGQSPEKSSIADHNRQKSENLKLKTNDFLQIYVAYFTQ